MAQHLQGRLLDYTLDGLTYLGGRVGLTSHGAASASPVRGVVSSAGYFGSFISVDGSRALINPGMSGATFIFSSSRTSSVLLPPREAGASFRFVVGTPPSSGLMHSINLAPGDVGLLYGGITSGSAVPPAVFADAASRIHFSDSAVSGDRVSVFSDGERWYVSDGICSVDGGISFS